MAVTDYQIETVLASVPFLQRVALALGTICQNIETEGTGTAQHAQRLRLASQIVTSMPVGSPWTSPLVGEFAALIVTQLNLATTSMVTVSGVANADVDTTDAALQTIISSIFNTFIMS